MQYARASNPVPFYVEANVIRGAALLTQLVENDSIVCVSDLKNSFPSRYLGDFME